MAYDEALAARIREVLDARDDVVEKRMFGGVAFMVAGKMAVGVIGERLMVRVGADASAEALARPHTLPMDFTGRPMPGMVYVLCEGLRTRAMLSQWIQRGIDGPPTKAAARSKRSTPSKPIAAKRRKPV